MAQHVATKPEEIRTPQSAERMLRGAVLLEFLAACESWGRRCVGKVEVVVAQSRETVDLEREDNNHARGKRSKSEREFSSADKEN